jgi:fatty-acyl-CoA synthase
VLRDLVSGAVDLATGAGVVLRSGVVRPVWPRPSLLGVGARTLLGGPTLASAVGLQAALQPRATALVDDRGALTWRALDERTTRLANALRDRAPRRSRIAFSLPNGREAVECYAGIAAAGMSAVPLSTAASPAELARIVAVQQPAVIVASPGTVDAVRAAAPDARIWLTGPDQGYESALAGASARPPLTGASAHVVTHTSGTTGAPKGAERELSSRSIEAFVAFLEKVPLRVDDTFLVAPPLFHTFAQGMMAAGLVLGSTLVLAERFEPRAALATMRAHDVDVVALVPAMLRRLLEVEAAPPPSLRIAVLSGSALPPALRARAEARLGRVLHDLYGSTEVGWATIATPADQARRPGTVGRPGRGIRVLVADDDGRVLPPGEVGRIHVATDFAFTGYTGGGIDRAVVDGAIDLGDLGYLDADGYLFVTGRADDMVVSGGENVHPSEVEAALEEHPEIAEAAVVGVDDEAFGQVLHAHVQPRDGAAVTPDDVEAFARERLARHKVPKRIAVVDALPRTATGKVVKGDLPPLP